MKLLRKWLKWARWALTQGLRGPSRATPATEADPGSPMIGNDGEWRRDRRTMRLLIQCIFRQAKLDAEDEALVDYLWERREGLDTYEDVLAALSFYAMTPFLSSVRRKNLLRAVNECRVAAKEVRNAYDGSKKPNRRAVYWPDSTPGTRDQRDLYDDAELPFAVETKFINEKTPIGSAGSCFAIEIREMLIRSGYNYVETEPNVQASARWGVLFNIPSIRQLAERAFEVKQTPALLTGTKKLRKEGDGDPKLYDPFREIGEVSFEQYQADYARHIAAAREAFLKCDVFIFTLGMVEVWRLKSDGSVFSRFTWGISPAMLEKHVVTYEENCADLQAALAILKHHNPRLKVLLSVSPVPLHATFQADRQHVIPATCYAKSVLRAVAEKVSVENDFVHYFPAYEAVMYNTPSPFIPDNRHVHPRAVRKVGLLFQKMFVENGARPLDLPSPDSAPSGAD
jgi:hypothetical protein